MDSKAAPQAQGNDDKRAAAPGAQPRPTNLAQAVLPAEAAHSRFVQRVRRRYAAEWARLPTDFPNEALMRQALKTLQAAGREPASAWRVMRHWVLERLVVWDVERACTLAQVAQAMTTLAEVVLDEAVREGRRLLDQRHGPLSTPQGQPIEFWVIGMGKLGARELNVSSDIDLIYVYDQAGQTHGPEPVSAQEYFAALARLLQQGVGDVTEDGQVFRMDLALRPHGQSGPVCLSLGALDDYLQAHGREWERLAWLKSRVVAPAVALRSPAALALRAVVTAFVYRRYLDYGVFEGLRQLHGKVRSEAQRRALGRPERANDVKLSRGGIREIEFIVQLLQVVRGGQFPEIRTRATLDALPRLVKGGLMKPEQAKQLAEDYTFLRRLEHRIQYLDDQQTHVVPVRDDDLDWIGRSMGLEAEPGGHGCALLCALDEVRERVAAEFDLLLHDGRSPAAASDAHSCKRCPGGSWTVDDPALWATLPPELAPRLQQWVHQGRVSGLRESTRLRLARLIRRAAHQAQAGQCTLAACVHFLDWLDPVLRRENYLALLDERPVALHRLLRLLGLARWPMRYLMRHPAVIDDLAEERLVRSRFEPADYRLELEGRHRAWVKAGEADEEALLDTLRHAHHSEVFRTLVRDVEGQLTVEASADDLSALADATVDCALQWSWQHLRSAHRPRPRMAVIAYGKLGGKELAYGSDLDLVFVYDSQGEADPDAAAVSYTALVRKLIQWLTLRTRAGELFEIDTALRPNGNSGLLVTSIQSFENYQVGRGSNTAWTWEHQAITRARFCAGDAELGEQFERVRRQVLQALRDPEALHQEVRDMRQKLQTAHRVPADRFDLKHSPGGMMDAEFAVQTLVLQHSARHPELADDVGNIALMHRAEAAGLLPQGVGEQAAQAYRALRRAQHQARLDEQSTQRPLDEWAGPQQAIEALWRAVFSPSWTAGG